VQRTLPEAIRTFMIISRLILLRIRNISDRSHRETQNTCFCFHIFFSESRAYCDVMWKNMVEPDRLQMTIQHDAYPLRAG
jgi:hypothetical protein